MKRNPFLTIPFQSFEIEKSYVLSPKIDSKNRVYTQLCYKDSSVEIQDIPILTPPLKIHHYDIRKSFLYLEIDPQHPFYQKLHRFQEFIVQTFYNFQNILLPHLIDDISSSTSHTGHNHSSTLLHQSSHSLPSHSQNISNSHIFSDNYTNQLKLFLSSHSENSSTKRFSLAKIRSFFQFPLKDTFLILYIHPNTILQTNKQHSLHAYQLTHGTYIRALVRLYNILTIKSPLNRNYLRVQHSVPSLWLVGPPKILRRPFIPVSSTNVTIFNVSANKQRDLNDYDSCKNNEKCLIIA